MGRGFEVFDAVGGAGDRHVRAGHDAVLAPQGYVVIAQARDVGVHHGGRAGQDIGGDLYAFPQLDYGFRLPAHEALVHGGRVAVFGDVAQVDEVGRLGVDQRVEVGAALRNLIVVHGEVGVELARHPLEEVARRGVEGAGEPAFFDHYGSKVGRGVPEYVAQAAARAGDEHYLAPKGGRGKW